MFIVLTASTLSYFYLNNDENKSNQYERQSIAGIAYYVEVKLNKSSDYKIRIPLAINHDGNVSEVMNNLSIVQGSGNFSINESSEEPCLVIWGSENLILQNGDQIVWNSSSISILSLSNSSSHNLNEHQSNRITRSLWIIFHLLIGSH
jgi:hypothetical protein